MTTVGERAPQSREVGRLLVLEGRRRKGERAGDQRHLGWIDPRQGAFLGSTLRSCQADFMKPGKEKAGGQRADRHQARDLRTRTARRFPKGSGKGAGYIGRARPVAQGGADLLEQLYGAQEDERFIDHLPQKSASTNGPESKGNEGTGPVHGVGGRTLAVRGTGLLPDPRADSRTGFNVGPATASGEPHRSSSSGGGSSR